jgi:hypothetical protein
MRKKKVERMHGERGDLMVFKALFTDGENEKQGSGKGK